MTFVGGCLRSGPVTHDPGDWHWDWLQTGRRGPQALLSVPRLQRHVKGPGEVLLLDGVDQSGSWPAPAGGEFLLSLSTRRDTVAVNPRRVERARWQQPQRLSPKTTCHPVTQSPSHLGAAAPPPEAGTARSNDRMTSPQWG